MKISSIKVKKKKMNIRNFIIPSWSRNYILENNGGVQRLLFAVLCWSQREIWTRIFGV